MSETKLTKIEETRELIQKKSKDILEILKGVTFENAKITIDYVREQIEEQVSKRIL